MHLPALGRIFPQLDINAIPSGRRRFGTASGSALTEYTLIGAGVAVLSIGALVMLGNTLGGIFHNMLGVNNYKPHVFASAHAPQASLTAQVSSTLNGAAANNSAAAIHAAAQGTVTQTAGVNGTTESYAQNIADSAKKALASGTIDQAQYDLIMQVANKGHDIAAIEAVLQNAHETNNLNGTLAYNGQTYSLMGLNSLLNRTVMDYASLRYEAQTSIPQSNSTLYTTLESGSSKIATLANNVYGSVRLPNEQYAALTASGGASNATNQNSASICTAGQHLDSNNHCTY